MDWQLRDNADWALIEARFSAHADWTGQPFVQNAAQAAKFMGARAAMTVRTSKDFLYMTSLYGKWPQPRQGSLPAGIFPDHARPPQCISR